jgi:hypothetical protein
MSDANRVELSYSVAETDYGVWEGTPALQAVQFTSESLKADTSTLRSEVIRADRNSPYIARNDFQASGDIGIELQWAAYDELMKRALLSSVFTTPAGTASQAVTSITSNVITFTTHDPTTNLDQWDWVILKDEGTTTVSPNHLKVGRISAITATTVTLDCVTLTDESTPTNNMSLTNSANISNGTTLITFGVQKYNQDLTSDEYVLYTGGAINMFGFGWESDGLITGTLGMLLKDELSDDTGKGTVTAAVGNPSLNAIDDVEEFYMNGGTTPINHTSFRWDLNNNLRGRKRVGTLGPFEMGTGTAEVSGSLTQHYLTPDMMDEYLAFNTVELAAKINCAGLGMYVLDLPAVKFSSGQRVAGGRNQDIMGEMAFEAFYDTTMQYTVRIHKLSYT